MPIPNYKEIVGLLKTGFTIEAQEKIMELREAAMELQEENLSLREKVSILEAQLKKAKELELRQGVYWMAGDGVPFCQFCYDKDGKLIHLEDGRLEWTHEWHCRACENVFGRRLRDSFH
jgi:hypothetical protein